MKISFYPFALIAVMVLQAACANQKTMNNDKVKPTTVEARPATTSEKNELVALISKMASSGESVAIKNVLPYLGITGIPPLFSPTPEYAYSQISANFRSEKNKRMIDLGLEEIFYSEVNSRGGDPISKHLNIKIDRNVNCVTVEDVRHYFGNSYKKTPSAVVAPVSMPTETAIGSQSSRIQEIAGMLYTGLFGGYGGVWVTFEFQRCAESISFNTWEKL